MNWVKYCNAKCLKTLFGLSAGQNSMEMLFFGAVWSLAGVHMSSLYEVVSTAVASGMIDNKIVPNNY